MRDLYSRTSTRMYHQHVLIEIQESVMVSHICNSGNCQIP